MRNLEYDQERMKQELVGQSVVTSYSRGGKHTYKVDDIDFNRNIYDTFNNRGKPITYKEYFKTHYKIELKIDEQPLLVCKDRRGEKTIHLIPEICEMTGLTDSQRANFKLMKEMATILHKDAEMRLKEVKNLMRSINSEEEPKKLI